MNRKRSKLVQVMIVMVVALGLLMAANPSAVMTLSIRPNQLTIRSDERFLTGDLPVSAEAFESSRMRLVSPTPALPTADWTRLVYQSARDGNWEIYSQQGGVESRLTYHSAADTLPRLNRGSTKIAFVSTRDGDPEIFTMNVDGGNVQQLTFNTVTDTEPVWSPDSSRLAFVSNRSGRWEVFVMNADGSGQIQLTRGSGSIKNVMPAWSPDGSQIAWVQINGTYSSLDLMNPDGSNPYSIAAGKPYLEDPIWSPNNGQLAFDFIPDRFIPWFKIGLVNRDGGGFGLIPQPGYVSVDFWAGSWSPMGDRIAYTRAEYNQRYEITGLWIEHDVPGNWGYFNKQRITSTGLDAFPDWQSADSTPPTSKIESLPPWTNSTSFTVKFSLSDDLSGIAGLSLQYKDGSGQWTEWSGSVENNSFTFNGLPAHTYYFRSRAIDFAGNIEPYPPGDGDTHTTIYDSMLSGSAFDNRDQPVAVVNIQANPAALNTGVSRYNGAYDLYFAAGGIYTLTTTRNNYSQLPPLLDVTIPSSGSLPTLYLPPSDNQISDSHFESGNLPAWNPSGDLAPTITSTAHTGNYAVLLGGMVPTDTITSGPWHSTIEQTLNVSPTVVSGTLSLLYRVDAVDPLSDTLNAYLIGANNTIAFTLPVTTSGWAHAWFDASAWNDPTATLKIDFVTGSAGRTTAAILDEITWGSAIGGSRAVFLPMVNR